MKSTYTVSQVRRIENEAVLRGVRSAFKSIVACLYMELLDKRGFELETVTDIIEKVNQQFENINDGYLSLDDICKTLKDEYGIEIE